MYYKVVTTDYKSAIMGFFNKGLQMQYEIGEFVFANEAANAAGYGLCVFNSLEAARNFNVAGNLIFEVDVMDVLPTLPARHSIWDVTLDNLSYINSQSKREWPDGTVMVRGVKLVKEIKGEN